jgi:hypothetical protein
MKRCALTFAFAVFLASTLSMQASTVAAATLTGGADDVSGLPAMPIELGFRFTPTVNINVTALGTWDAVGASIPAGSEVGLFDNGTLLSSVSFNGGSTVQDGFAYVDLGSAVTLDAGTAYTILSYFPASTTVPINLLGSPTFNSDLSDVHFTNSYLNPGDGLTFLGTIPGGLSDYSQFGANFLFEAAPASVPEPASAGLVMAGVFGLFTFVRRKRTLLR